MELITRIPPGALKADPRNLEPLVAMLPTGTPPQIADDIKRYADVGVRHMMVNLQGDTLEQTLARMQRFADRIMPLTA